MVFGDEDEDAPAKTKDSFQVEDNHSTFKEPNVSLAFNSDVGRNPSDIS